KEFEPSYIPKSSIRTRRKRRSMLTDAGQELSCSNCQMLDGHRGLLHLPFLRTPGMQSEHFSKIVVEESSPDIYLFIPDICRIMDKYRVYTALLRRALPFNC